MLHAALSTAESCCAGRRPRESVPAAKLPDLPDQPPVLPASTPACLRVAASCCPQLWREEFFGECPLSLPPSPAVRCLDLSPEPEEPLQGLEGHARLPC